MCWAADLDPGFLTGPVLGLGKSTSLHLVVLSLTTAIGPETCLFGFYVNKTLSSYFSPNSLKLGMFPEFQSLAHMGWLDPPALGACQP